MGQLPVPLRRLSSTLTPVRPVGEGSSLYHHFSTYFREFDCLLASPFRCYGEHTRDVPAAVGASVRKDQKRRSGVNERLCSSLRPYITNL